MTDMISRQAALDALGDEPEVWTGNDEYAQGLNNQWHYDVNALKAVPSADAVPVRHGRWGRAYLDHVAMGERPSVFYCSVCGQCIAYPVNYCPNCGARMDGDHHEG